MPVSVRRVVMHSNAPNITDIMVCPNLRGEQDASGAVGVTVLESAQLTRFAPEPTLSQPISEEQVAVHRPHYGEVLRRVLRSLKRLLAASLDDLT